MLVVLAALSCGPSAQQVHLENVARIFGFSDADFARLRAEHIGPDSADPYTVLGMTPDMEDDAIKSAYRKLVRENHPDTLIAQGMPEEFIEVANDKLAAINAAYDKIRDAGASKPIGR